MRLPNLIILMLTLYIIAVYGIHPPLVANGITPILTNKEYYLFIFIITCIGAGGYVYNDIIDQRSDMYNDKRKIIGHAVTKKLGLALYWFITITPLLAVLSLSMEVNQPNYLVYYVLLVFIFWLYNTHLQKIALVGNITVALLCALTVVVPFVLDHKSMSLLQQLDPLMFTKTIEGILFFSIFCFTANLIREIIKDVEDIKGDQQIGYRTLPIVIGKEKTQIVLLFLTALFILLLIIWSIIILQFTKPSNIVACVLLLFPLFIIFIVTKKADTSDEYKVISQYWKMYLLIGLLVYILISI